MIGLVRARGLPAPLAGTWLYAEKGGELMKVKTYVKAGLNMINR